MLCEQPRCSIFLSGTPSGSNSYLERTICLCPFIAFQLRRIGPIVSAPQASGECK